MRLPFDLMGEWDVEWAGHPNWYFLISKFSIPWLFWSLNIVSSCRFSERFSGGGRTKEVGGGGRGAAAGAGAETVNIAGCC